MKLSKNCKKSELDSFNSKQVEFIRHEATSVKECFTTQAHQTLIISSTILSACVGALHLRIELHFLLSIASFLAIILCLTTIRVGCHKFNTANRTVAYQIHLSRAVDYKEASKNIKSKLIEKELRRINWEEAMFAWRMVQPVIFHFFYKEIFMGLCFKRFKNNKCRFDEQYQDYSRYIHEYPWYDSKEIIKLCNTSHNHKFPAEYYPGTYLKSMLNMLYAVMCIGLLIFWYSLKEIMKNILSSSTILLTFGSYLLLIFSILFTLFIIHGVIKSYLRCKILESGLLSIQTSGFVWRIVCVAHLIAKFESIKESKSKINIKNQIYNGYTEKLAIVASNLVYKLKDPHFWLEEQEKKIYKFLTNKIK